MQLVSNHQTNMGVALQGLSTYSNREAQPNGDEASQSSIRSGQEDTISLSPKGRAQAANEPHSTNSSESDKSKTDNNNSSSELSKEELAELQKLKQRDTEVRTHEQAHMSAAGQFSRGGPSFSLEKGPDGKSYAVGGEVNIDVGKERTPEETVTKMRVIKQAALAPANPSSADRRIAAQASVKEAQARQEISANMQETLLEPVKHTEGPSEPNGEAPKVPGDNSAPTNSVGTLKKTMIEAYQQAASY